MLELKRNPRNPLADYPAYLLLAELEDLREGYVNQILMADTSEEADMYRQKAKAINEVLGRSDHIIDKLIKGEMT